MRTLFPPLFVFAFFLLLLSNPSVSIAAASEGLTIWYSQVVPSLFPSMILTSFLVSTNLFFALFSRLPHISSIPFSRLLPVISGMICGYPMGAKTCADLYRIGQLSPDEVGILNRYVHCPSPMFLIGFVSSVCLPSIRTEHLLPAIYLPIGLSVLFSWPLLSKTASSSSDKTKQSICFSMELFDEVYNKSLRIIIRIACYLMFFTILNRLLTQSLPAFSTTITILGGLLEMTWGIRSLAHLPVPVLTKELIAVFVLGFGGISTLLQVRDALGKDLFRIRPYLLHRILHAASSTVIYFFLSYK
ncbi:MAG: hypothetical protein IJ468_02735 [Lachnospiraceae bacterium]|nr:hypothetical protein [Lachnospiraceae bacterium]